MLINLNRDADFMYNCNIKSQSQITHLHGCSNVYVRPNTISQSLYTDHQYIQVIAQNKVYLLQIMLLTSMTSVCERVASALLSA